MRVFAGVVLLLGLTGPAAAQTFDFTFDQFRERLDKQLTTDHGDTIKACKKSNLEVQCSVNDKQFQESIAGLKKLNLVNGYFTLKQSMLVSTDRGGKVTSIIYSGDRGDPSNLLHFVGQIGGVIVALKPGLPDKDVQRLFKELGLIRGDSDPSIGQPMLAIEEFAAIRCNSQRSDVSTAVGCVFGPRY